MPASNTAKSHPLSWKCRQASANSASNAPNFSPIRFETVGDGSFDPQFQASERVVADLDAIDLNPFVETQEMRRGEQAGPQAIGAADLSAHRRRAALAVRAGHHHRDALQPRAIDSERFQQSGHAREADAVAVFRQVEHYSSPMAEKV